MWEELEVNGEMFLGLYPGGFNRGAEVRGSDVIGRVVNLLYHLLLSEMAQGSLSLRPDIYRRWAGAA